MQIKINELMHNTYTFRLINALTGELKQKIQTTNIITNNFWFWNLGNVMRVYFRGLWFGNGEGTPQATDNSLFSTLWYYGGFTLKEVKKENNYRVMRLAMTVPASTSYVGNITEIGLRADYNDYRPDKFFISHAMLKDAEGNNISVNKTDIDKLEIEVEIRIMSYQDETTGFICPAENGYIVDNNEISIVGSPTNIVALLSCYKNQLYTLGTFTGGSYSWDDSLLKGVATAWRLGTDVGNGHYLNYIEIAQLGRFKLPNSNLMPPMEVKGVSIGTGDGVTTDFEPPVDLFIKDTDKIYVDGVLKTRDVDYTIDNKSNRHLLHEITPGNFMQSLSGGTEKYAAYDSTNRSLAPFTPIVASDDITIPYNNALYKFTTYYYKVVDGNNPVVIELEEDPTIGLDINRCKFRYFYIMGQYGTSSFTDVDLVLEYSKDGITFIEVGRVDLTGYSYGNELNLEFATVKAKYWRLSLNFDRASESEQEKKATHYLSFRDNGNLTMSMLYYYGEPIKFTNPPAEGAVITMDCTLDRPFKTENWVVDFGYEIQV